MKEKQEEVSSQRYHTMTTKCKMHLVRQDDGLFQSQHRRRTFGGHINSYMVRDKTKAIWNGIAKKLFTIQLSSF